MFGFSHFQALIADASSCEHLIDTLLAELDAFTGPNWEQEDDVTLVALYRSGLSH